MAKAPPPTFGADRIEAGPGEEILLVCPSPKQWLPRRDRTLTTAEYPGTAVEWEGAVYEVRGVEPQPGGSVRYRLAPWEEGHAIRRMERYDESSESAREAVQADRRDGLRKRRLSILLAPLAGLLPGEVQKDMENEFGAPAIAMTVSSALPLAVAGFLGVFERFIGGLGGGIGLPAWLAPPAPIALYVAVESALRLASAIAMREPMGTLPVVVAYQAWREARAPVKTECEGRETPGDAARDRSDRFRLLEPLLSLLPPAEQRVLAERFPFDFVRWGRITAGILLLVGGSNVFASIGNLAAGRFESADLAWLVAGGILMIEQLLRWRRLSRGEAAGSFLGALVRPLARPLIAAPGSRALRAGG